MTVVTETPNRPVDPMTKVDHGENMQTRAEQRAAFEAWLLDEQGLTATWDEERNCYEEFPAHLAWRAWLAASN